MTGRDRKAAANLMEQTLKSVKAIYFDLDDTLCGYWDASKAGLRRAFEQHGPEGVSPEEMVHHWATAFRKFAPTLKQTGWYEGYLKCGEPTRTEQMRLTLAQLGIEDPERAAALSRCYMESRDEALTLFEDARPVLELLRSRFPLGLITNGPADIQRMEIETLGLGDLFAHVFIEGEMGEGKPLRAVFDRAAAAVGFPPEHLLFVGNSYAHDIRPALEAGWHAVWVRRSSDVPPSTRDLSSQPEELPAGSPQPDAEIENLAELLPLLGIAPAEFDRTAEC